MFVNMKKHRGYMFTKRKHPKSAIIATVLGAISLLSEIYAIISSYVKEGNVPGRYGVAGALSVLYALIGICISLYLLRDKENFLFFSVVGLILCGAALMIAAFLLWIPT